MPYNTPPRDSGADKKPSRQSAGVASLVQAERLMQIAFVLPCAMLIGWGAGWWLDSKLHTEWLGMAGLILGIAAGMVSAVRMALQAGKSPKSAGKSGDSK
jgi:F0F1-type ATP synthase assembly protein I